jgi:hypothetical protein
LSSMLADLVFYGQQGLGKRDGHIVAGQESPHGGLKSVRQVKSA